MDNRKRPISTSWFLIFLTLINVSCFHKEMKEIKMVEIIAKKDTSFNIYQNVSSPSTLLLNISKNIENNGSFLVLSFEDSESISNRNIKDTIKIKNGEINYGTDLFEPHFVLYYKSMKTKKGKINVNIKIY